METELLKTFDANGTETGTATREVVHRKGLWHETFQCWLISKEEGKNYIYFQLRSRNKKDYPNLLDITAAGHLLAHETTADGVRELEEEIGIRVSLEELQFLGMMKYEAINGELIDRELANVYVHHFTGTMEDFLLQKEEVAGIYKADFVHVCELFLGHKTELSIHGFEVKENGERVNVEKIVTKNHFVPHDDRYYLEVFRLLKEKI